MARVKLSSMPAPPREYTIDFPRLDGGLNTWDLSYRLDANESPEMKNLWWKNGALCSRDGQVYLNENAAGVGHTAYETLFYDHIFFHIGDKLYSAYIPEADVLAMWLEGVELKEIRSGVSADEGAWFRYGAGLYYKNKGGYYCISVDGESVTCSDVPAYTPVILINTDPTTAAGEEYQSENRLSGQKTVWYSTVSGVKEYHLPVQNIDSIDKVIVDGTELTDGYSVDLIAGTVTFSTEPKHHEPVRVNTVRIITVQ